MASTNGAQAAGGTVSRSVRPDGAVSRVVDRRGGELRVERKGRRVVGLSVRTVNKRKSEIGENERKVGGVGFIGKLAQ